MNAALTEKEEYMHLYHQENKSRKAIHNKLMELQGNIRVICRVRPVLEFERKTGQVKPRLTRYPKHDTISPEIVTRNQTPSPNMTIFNPKF